MPKKCTPVPLVCPQCGATFEVFPSEATDGRVHCSRACMAAAYAAKPNWQRVWSKVDYGGPGCWNWIGHVTVYGYGALTAEGGQRGARATRIIWRMLHGESPVQVCHHCDNPRCCRPSHLYAGTHQTNADDRARRGRARYVPKAKVTEAQVREIRALHAAGVGPAKLGRTYGIAPNTVGAIVTRRSWPNVV